MLIFFIILGDFQNFDRQLLFKTHSNNNNNALTVFIIFLMFILLNKSCYN